MSQEIRSATIKIALLLFFAGLIMLRCMDDDGARGKETMNEITSDRFDRSETENGATRGMSPNRLIDEKSPYLLQHAYNPVNWHPWGDEAFELARKEDKPIFLSIGYSTCHWCHVMEHESFEDSTIAALMNDAFVSIKVDREERPDIDNVYMTVCQMMTGSGGWPLTIIMTPDKRPFFAGTYFPRENRFGRVGMIELVPRISDAWESRREELLSSANQITWALQNASATTSSRQNLGIESLRAAFESLASAFDEKHGGFGIDRKFPVPHNLLFLLRYWKRTDDSRALNMVEETLRHMRQGGIYDHVGFGFHRYATDPEWLVPHFEKMLYDQALISLAFVEAYQATGKDEYAQTAREIFEYVLRDMTSPGGGFYSAEDADSEGEEGKFYVWTESELRELLGENDSEIVIRAFNISSDGNFREESTGLMTGSNILHTTESMAALASQMNIDQSDLADKLEKSRKKLFEYREKRVHPYKDDKILTDWNGLMIAALARGAQVLGDEVYSYAAMKAADFILGTLRTDDGRLLHRYRDGEAAVDGYVDDYALLTWGLLELYEATFDAGFLNTAMEINQQMLEHFWDDSSGGLFFSADDSEELISRTKEIYDGAVPSGNSVAMLNMIRLGRMTADPDMEQRAAELAQSFAGTVGKSPSNHTMLMSAVDFAVGPSHEIIVVGDRESDDTGNVLSALRREYLPNKVVLFKPNGGEKSEIERIAGYLSDHILVDGKATVYVCVNYQCRTPVTDMEDMLKLIQ